MMLSKVTPFRHIAFAMVLTTSCDFQSPVWFSSSSSRIDATATDALVTSGDTPVSVSTTITTTTTNTCTTATQKLVCTNDSNNLNRARVLIAPLPNATLYGEAEGSDFWQTHANLIRDAWNQWEQQQQQQNVLPQLSREHIDPRLRVAVESAWNSGRAAADAMAATKGDQDACC